MNSMEGRLRAPLRRARAVPRWPTMGERRRQGRLSRLMAATAVLGVVLLPVVACSGHDDASSAPTTTVDPLNEAVVDSCGNDLGTLHSTVWAIDPATGAVRWTATVPLGAGYLLRSDDGAVLVPLEKRSVDVLLDPATGAVVGYPPAGVHEVLVDSTGVATGVVGMQVVDGEQQPAQVTAAGLLVEVATGGSAVAARGVDPATGTAAWTSPLSGGGRGEGASRPVIYDDAVVIAAPAQPVPACD